GPEAAGARVDEHGRAAVGQQAPGRGERDEQRNGEPEAHVRLFGGSHAPLNGSPVAETVGILSLRTNREAASLRAWPADPAPEGPPRGAFPARARRAGSPCSRSRMRRSST